MRKPKPKTSLVTVPKVGDVAFDIFRPGQSFFEGTADDIRVKKWLLTNVREAMEGKKGDILHPKQKQKFSADIQQQILFELTNSGSIEFVCALLTVLTDFWPDDALRLIPYLDYQDEPLLAKKVAKIMSLYDLKHRAQLGL